MKFKTENGLCVFLSPQLLTYMIEMPVKDDPKGYFLIGYSVVDARTEKPIGIAEIPYYATESVLNGNNVVLPNGHKGIFVSPLKGKTEEDRQDVAIFLKAAEFADLPRLNLLFDSKVFKALAAAVKNGRPAESENFRYIHGHAVAMFETTMPTRARCGFGFEEGGDVFSINDYIAD